MKESHSDKYYSVSQLINLPQLRKINPQNLNPLNSDETQKYPEIPVSIKQSKYQLLRLVQNEVYQFSEPEYNFRFPNSFFPDGDGSKSKKSKPKKRQNVFEQQTFGHKLTDEQIQQIKQTGQFKIPSNHHQNTPHVWKLNQCLVRGKKNIRQIWSNGLDTCASILQESGKHFVKQIPESLKTIGYLPIKLFDLIFGKKSVHKFYTPDYHRQVISEFWQDIMDNELKNVKSEVAYPLFEILYVYFNPQLDEPQFQLSSLQRNKRNAQLQNQSKNQEKVQMIKRQLQEVEQNFRPLWLRIRFDILNRISNVNLKPASTSLSEEELNTLRRKLGQEKFSLYINHIKAFISQAAYSSQSVQALVHIIVIFRFVEARMRRKQDQLNLLYSQLKDSIRQDNPICSHFECYVNDEFQKQYAEKSLKLQNSFYEQLVNDPTFKSFFPPVYFSIFQKYIKFRSFYDTLILRKKSEMVSLYEPTRVFKSSYRLLPPYEVQKKQNYIQSNFQSYNYSLKKQFIMQTDTASHFWKFKLYWMRLITWTVNWLITLIGLSWVGPLGLRCLCGIDDFSYDQYINYDTGVKSYDYRQTVLGKFRNVLESIGKSRQQFQSQPDLGLLGKSFSRLCNLFECYILRFIIVGVIGVLVLYPILIIASSIICLFLVISFWFWVPVGMLLCYLFNILIFQYEIALNEGCLIRSVPLLSIAGRLVFSILRIIFAFLLLFLFAPLLSVLYFIFLVIQRILRTILDSIMLCIIKICGRTPSRDTNIARKISGPGTNTLLYDCIPEQDVHILVRAELQKCVLQKFRFLTIEQIQKPKRRLDRLLEYISISTSALSKTLEKVRNNQHQLQVNFNNSYEKFSKRFPNYYNNVRFTREELDSYFLRSVNMVKLFITQSKISGWIFEQNGLSQNNYEELTKIIWRKILGYSIFEPLEELDNRIMIDQQVTDNQMKLRNTVGSIIRTLEGEIEKPTQYKQKYNRAEDIFEKDEDLRFIRSLCQLHELNRKNKVNLDANDIRTLLVAPRNLQLARAYTKKNEESARRSKQLANIRIIEETEM